MDKDHWEEVLDRHARAALLRYVATVLFCFTAAACVAMLGAS